MTLQLQAITLDTAWGQLREVTTGAASSAGDLSASDLLLDDDELTSEDVEVIAEALDRMREVCAAIGQMTLRAQLAGATAEEICSALDTVAAAGVRALTDLLDA